MISVSHGRRDSACILAHREQLASLIHDIHDFRFLPLMASLAEEPDPELYSEGLLRLGGKLAATDQFESAGKIYQALLAQDVPVEIQDRARQELETLVGRGTFGQRFEFLAPRFTAQVTNPISLVSMGLGGLAFRATRLAALCRLLSSSAESVLGPWAARTLAAATGLLAESAVFTSARRGTESLFAAKSESAAEPWIHEFSSTALFLGSLRMTGWLGSNLGRQIEGASTLSSDLALQGTFRKTSQAALTLTSNLTGIVLGNQLETTLGLRPDAPKDRLWLDGLSTLLQFHVAVRLSQEFFGENFVRQELVWDLQSERILDKPLRRPPPGAALAWAGWTPPKSLTRPPAEALRHVYFSMRPPSEESGLVPLQANALINRFRPYFPPDTEGFYSQEILRKACGIHCDLPDFHVNLLEALQAAPNRGTKDQLITVIAIDRIFGTDALTTVTGNFDYAPLQTLLARTLAHPDPIQRQLKMQNILQGFEQGFTRARVAELLTESPHSERLKLPTEPIYSSTFHHNYSEHAGNAWSEYRSEDVVPLFNFVFQQSAGDPVRILKMIDIFGKGRKNPKYPATDIEGALDYARNHPLGQLLLQRLFDIFAAKDLPAKLREIADDPVKIDTHQYFTQQARRGVERMMLEYKVNGTAHTAHLNDLRLARKLTSVFSDVAPFLNDSSLRDQAKWNLSQEFLKFTAEYQPHTRPLEVGDLMRLLNANANPQGEAMVLAWMGGQFDVQILPPQEFQRRVAEWGKAECDYSMYVQASSPGEKDTILIKDLPPLRFDNAQELNVGFAELMYRVKALVHEIEHWRHFNPDPRQLEHPIRLAGISREERLVSEMMAYLEEFRWRVRNTDDDYLQISRRLGEPLAMYLRGIAERSYFASENRPKAIR